MWGATAIIETRPIEALYRQTELVNVTSDNRDGEFPVLVDFRNTASAKFTYLTFMPFVKYVQLHPLFFAWEQA